MIRLRNKSISQGAHTCSKCNGKGTIQVFRNDWEELDEIKCEACATLRD